MQPSYQDRLIDLIYGAMLDEVPWTSFVDAIGEGLPGGRTTLFYHDPGQASGRYLLTSNMADEDVRAYNEVWAPLNPWMPAAAKRPVGLGVVAEQMLDPSLFQQSALYNEFLRPLDCHSATGITIERSNGRLFLLSILTSRPDPEANREHARTLSAIAPHLQRAFRHIRHGGNPAQAGETALDALGVGVLVVGQGCGCRRMSRLAQSLLATNTALRLDGTSRLRLTDRNLDSVLQLMLRSDGTGPSHHEAILLDSSEALRVILVRIATDALSECLQGPTVVVLLDPLTGSHDGTRPDFRTLQGLAARHKLTRAETEVLQALASGLSIDQVARQRGASRETVRGQVRALFAKTGAKRQADLVRLVLAPGRAPI